MHGPPHHPKALAPHSPAALGHPHQRSALTLWSEARLRAAVAPGKIQRALMHRQPQAIAAVSLLVWLPTVLTAMFVLPGSRDSVALVIGAVVFYPFLLVLTALGSRLLTRARTAPALELARRIGQAPLDDYEAEARAQLAAPEPPSVVMLLRVSQRTESLLRITLWEDARGRYDRVESRPLQETHEPAATCHNQGPLTPREALLLWNLVRAWQPLSGVASVGGSAIQLCVLRAGTPVVQRFSVAGAPSRQGRDDQPADWMAHFLTAMEGTRLPFPDEAWMHPA